MIDSLLPLDLTPESEITARVRALKIQMSLVGMDGILLTHRPDIYYFSGTAQEAWLYIALDRDPLLFVKRYLPRAQEESSLKQIVPVGSIKEIPGIIHQKHWPKIMGLAFDLVPVRDYRFYQTLFPGTLFADATPMIEACRSIKSPHEIQKMEGAAKASARIFDFMADHLAPGILETEFCGMIEAFARTQGHSGKIQMRHYRSTGFSFHLMSGETGGIPGALDSPVCGTGTCTAYPFGAGPKPIGEKEPILIDYATMVRGYHMDESRTFVLGKMPDDAMAASQAAVEILYGIKEVMKPGAVIGETFDLSVSLAHKLGFEDEYLGIPGLKSRFVGHGIGLELVENPILAKGRTQELEPGMVFAVEPKFIFKDRFATGIESVILVTQTGSRFLSVTENRVFRV